LVVSGAGNLTPGSSASPRSSYGWTRPPRTLFARPEDLAVDYSAVASACLVDVPILQVTFNDQQPVGRVDALLGPLWFLWLALSSGLRRQQYR
jgi:hypothetical protein